MVFCFGTFSLWCRIQKQLQDQNIHDWVDSSCSNLVLCGFQMHDTTQGRVFLCKIFLTEEHWEREETVS